MIHYPPDIHFTAWESSIPADQLMRLLRRQLHWAQQEGDEVKKEVEELEQQKREEWTLKEILLEGVMEAELSKAQQSHLLKHVDSRVRDAMERDVQFAKVLNWTGGEPEWRRAGPPPRSNDGDVEMRTPPDGRSPPPTGVSGGGFDGEADPYDNYLADMTSRYEELQRQRNTPHKAAAKDQQAAEADAVGALIGMSGQS